LADLRRLVFTRASGPDVSVWETGFARRP